MKLSELHTWDLTPKEAIALQKQLCARIVHEDDVGEVHHVAGIDVGFEDGGATIRAAAAVLRYPGLALVDQAIVRAPTRFPYVPGLLSFREAPAVLEALCRLHTAPDLILYDGQGIAHPRRFGIASHVGLLAGVPSIGVAKSRLIGEPAAVPVEPGAWAPLMDRGELIGAVLRTRRNVKPLFVSIGHRVSLETAVGWVLACLTRYRLPETTRWAHRLASAMPRLPRA